MQKERKIEKQNLFFALLLVFMTVVSIFAPTLKAVFAEEATSNYTSALEDLQQSKDFDKSLYNVDKTDKQTVNFITLAKSVKNELFIYTYQPNPKEYFATSINLSYEFLSQNSFDSSQEIEHLQSGEETNYQNYELTFINHNGVFYKYKVKNFTLEENKTISTHYFDISSIFRNYNKFLNYDIETYGGTISEVPFAVGKRIAITYVDNELKKISSEDIELINIIDKYTGYVRYENGGGFFTYDSQGYDSHFIAFDTDKNIDKLLQVELIYSKQHIQETYWKRWHAIQNSTETFGDIENNIKISLDYDDIFNLTINGSQIERNRIQTGEEFLQMEYNHTIQQYLLFDKETIIDLTDQAKQDIGNKQFVLRFAETDYTLDEHVDQSWLWWVSVLWGSIVYPTETNIDYDIISDVSVLKLTFESEGILYNLGAIDIKASSSKDPSNNTNTIITAPTWLKNIWEFIKNNKVLFIIIAVLVLAILASFVPFIAKMFELFFKGIILLFKGIWYILSLPFKLFKK